MKRAISLFNLVFMIPAIVLSFMVWNDYSSRIEDSAKQLAASDRSLFFLDGGSKVMSVEEDDDTGLRGELYDVKTQQLLKKVPLRSNLHGQLVSTYQNGRLILVTLDDSDQLNIHAIDSEGGVKELVQKTVELSGFLDSSVHPWRGKLIVSGETNGSVPFIAQVEKGKLQKVNLDQPKLLPSRPTFIREVTGSFESDAAVPMFEVDLHDDRNAFVSGWLNPQNTPLTYVQKDNETSFDAKDHAARQFAAQLGRTEAGLLQVDSSYPKQVRYYDAATKKTGSVLPTPMPVYQAQLYPLNDRETLIAGSTTKDEAEGHVLGYLYDEKTKQFTDVSAIVSLIPYEDLKSDRLHFYKEAGSSVLLYSNAEASAGWMNIRDGSLNLLNNQTFQQWLAAKDENRKSVQSFMAYLKQGDAVVINWAIWVLIAVLVFGSWAILPPLLRASRKRRLDRGVTIPGTITNMSETGTLVNNQPLVRLTVRFQDEGRTKEVAISKVVSYLNPVHVGDSVMISYDRRKNKAMFLTSADLPEQAEHVIIGQAVLKRIDFCGNVNRGSALLLHFEAGGKPYSIPVVQAAGFEYRTGETAALIQVGGLTRLYAYGSQANLNGSDRLNLEGEVIRIQPFEVTINDRQLLLFETLISHGRERLRKVNSQFVPRGLSVQVGNIIPASVKKEELDKEIRLLQGKQGSGKVTSVSYSGTNGDRPLARITVERNGEEYYIEQSVEPVYGVETGDELWIAYDEHSREAIIIQYAVA